MERGDLRLGGDGVGALLAIARGEAAEVPPRQLLYLRYLGLVQGHGATAGCSFPTFDAAEMEQLLLPPLWHRAEQLVEEAVVPALTTGGAAPWWRDRTDLDSVRHALVRLVLEVGTDRVIDAGVLEPFPRRTPPPAWGRWLWEERSGQRTLVAGAFDDDDAAAPREAAGG